MDIFVWVVVLPHEVAPKVCGVYFELAQAQEAAADLDESALVDRAQLHA